VIVGVTVMPMQASEPARIRVPQQTTAGEHEVQVVVSPRGNVVGNDAEPPRHAKVKDQRPRFELQQQIFCAPRDLLNLLAAKVVGKRHRPAQSRVANDHRFDARAFQDGTDSANGRLDFGKLRHLSPTLLDTSSDALPRRPDATRPRLLYFRLFVDHVLANDGIVLLEFELIGRIPLVFVGRVVVTRASAGDELDFVSHAYDLNLMARLERALLDLDPAGAHVRQHGLDAVLVDQTHALCRHLQANEPLLALHPESVEVQVRHEAPSRRVPGVGSIVPAHRALARHLTNLRHDST